MKIRKAVITCAGPKQRKLPLQTLIDRNGEEKTILAILIDEILVAGIEEIACVISPGDEDLYAEAAGEQSRHLTFVSQNNPRGYGHAILLAQDFVGEESFLHLVGDHLYVNRDNKSCAGHLISVAEKEACAVSAVTAIREHDIPNYGVVGCKRIHGSPDLYKVEKVMEKPTPTIAEQHLLVPGLRAGHYLGFFGMHVLTPSIFDILAKKLSEIHENEKINLSDSLHELAKIEQYLVLEKNDWRYDVGIKYGLLKAQTALALSGKDRDKILMELLELFTNRELGSKGR